MIEKIKFQPQPESFESDRERLRFLERSIIKRIREIRKNGYQIYAQTLDTFRIERGIEIGGYIPHEHREEVMKLRDESEKTIDQAVIEGLDNFRMELGNNSALKNFIPEMNALIEAARTMFLAKQTIKYKERQFMSGAPELSKEELKKQEALREDMTEGRTLIQWHVLQNENNPEYLKAFDITLKQLLGDTGFKEEWHGMERGLRQELGISKILKKYFKKVTPGKPKEDAHYAIDFWAETEDGKTIIFQSKSSSLFGGQGVFDEQDMQKLERELAEGSNSDVKYQTGWGGYEPPVPDLVKIRKFQQDAEKAKSYAASLGIENPKFYLIVSSANNFEEITGEPILGKNNQLEKQLESFK